MRAKSGVAIVLMLALLALAACAPGGDDGGKGEDVSGELEATGGGYTYRRTGGIAGFCDIVRLEADGAATVSSCASEPPRTVAETRLSTAQMTLVSDWAARLVSFEREQTDPATADALTISVTFSGQGDEQPSENDVAAMIALAQEVLIQATR